MGRIKSHLLGLSSPSLLGLFSLILALSFPQTCSSEEVYRWVDNEGTVHYSDSPSDSSIFDKHNVRTISLPTYPRKKQKESTEEIKEQAGKETQQPQQEASQIVPTDGSKKQSQTTREVIQVHQGTETTRVIGIREEPQKLHRSLQFEKYNQPTQARDDTKQQEYERKRKQIEELDTKIKKYNAEVKKHNDQLETERYIREREKAARYYEMRRRKSTGCGGNRKPYLEDEYRSSR